MYEISEIIKGKKLSRQQRKLSEFFSKNSERAAFMTAARVSKETGVSEATVVRFAAALGFSGYTDFQRALREEAKGKLNSVKRMEIVSEKIGGSDVLKNVLKSDMAQLEKTRELIDKSEFSRAVEALISAKNIYIVGMRSCAALASFVGFYFNMMFENVKIISGNSAESITEKMIRTGSGDVVFGISFPRYSASVVKAVSFAKERGATVVTLTDGKNSPVANFSDIILTASSEMESFADSLVAPMSIINALILAVGYKKKTELSKTFEELEEVLKQQEVYDL